jgi:hypothetical protein
MTEDDKAIVIKAAWQALLLFSLLASVAQLLR